MYLSSRLRCPGSATSLGSEWVNRRDNRTRDRTLVLEGVATDDGNDIGARGRVRG